MRHRVGGHDRMRPRWTCTLITIAAERPRLQRSGNAAVYRSGLRLDDGIAEIRSVPRESTWINSLPDAGHSKDARRKCHPLRSPYCWHEPDHSATHFPRPSTLCWGGISRKREPRPMGRSVYVIFWRQLAVKQAGGRMMRKALLNWLHGL